MCDHTSSIPQAQIHSLPINIHIGTKIIKYSWNIILKQENQFKVFMSERERREREPIKVKLQSHIKQQN